MTTLMCCGPLKSSKCLVLLICFAMGLIILLQTPSGIDIQSGDIFLFHGPREDRGAKVPIPGLQEDTIVQEFVDLENSSLPKSSEDNKERMSRTYYNMEDLIDFARCPSGSPLKIFVYKSERPIAEYIRKSEYYTEHSVEACLFLGIIENVREVFSFQFYEKDGSNHILMNVGETQIVGLIDRTIIVQSHFDRRYFRPMVDYESYLDLKEFNKTTYEDRPYILPVTRKYAFCRLEGEFTDEEAKEFESSLSEGMVHRIDCGSDCSIALRECVYTVLASSAHFQARLVFALRGGSIPVVASTSQPMPFQDTLDWRLASFRFSSKRLSMISTLQAVAQDDILEMKRRGRIFLDSYLDNAKGWTNAFLSSLSVRLGLPLRPPRVVHATPLFGDSFTAPETYKISNQTVPAFVTNANSLDWQKNSRHKATSMNLYSYNQWNNGRDISHLPETLFDSSDRPAESEFYEGTKEDMSDIQGAKKIEDFKRGLGGNRPSEKFTIILLTYNRDEALKFILEGLYGTPYLHKILIIWNNLDRTPNGAWPKLDVPVEFIKPEKNSLSNRFIPYDRIETDAVVSIDDDMHIDKDELVYAFRVWRENPDRIVGFPDRYHRFSNGIANYGAAMTCQYSMILTSFAFVHKNYHYEYTFNQHPLILEHIDEKINCEDIAINYIASHLTRKAPIKVGLKTNFFCGRCKSGLSASGQHYSKRDYCMRLFNKIYGYNPLRLSQMRVNSPAYHKSQCMGNI